MLDTDPEVLGIIPARFASSRFPGKPLAEILGKSLLQRTYENSLRAKRLSRLVVATDDEKIASHVKEFGGEVVMTSIGCRCGTDRVAEAVETYFKKASYIVNIQGDEPCINPDAIDAVIEGLVLQEDCPIMTAVSKISDPKHRDSPSIVKCIFTTTGKALYFSRSKVPYAQKGTGVYYRHLGIYAFRRKALSDFVRLPITPNQETEDLEQLKALEHGVPIFVTEVQDLGIGVDRPEDIKTIEQML